MNLLIADDEAVIRRGLLSLDWKSIGITDVYSVANGVEAKELLLSTSIDLVIFDYQNARFQWTGTGADGERTVYGCGRCTFVWIFRI